MELLDALKWRYASKKMNGVEVPEEKVQRILEAIQLAPSSMGLQPYNVLVIKDVELKKQILPIANNQQQIIDSSHLLVFAAWDKITPDHVDDYMNLTASTRNVSIESLEPFKNVLLKIASRSPEENYDWAARQTYPTLQLIRPKLSDSDSFRIFRWRFVYYKFNLFKRFGFWILQGTMYFFEVF